MDKKINEIVFREDLYPRFEPNQKIIQKYSESIEFLPPIKINQNNILIDGFHRWKAHQLAKIEKINVEIIKTGSEFELKIMAYQLNSIHGFQLNTDEKQKFAREMFGILNDDEIMQTLSIGKATFYRWTETQRENAKKEQARKTLELYLKCWTQEQIADELKISQKNVSDVLENFSKNSKNGKNTKTFELFIYNIWNILKMLDTGANC